MNFIKAYVLYRYLKNEYDSTQKTQQSSQKYKSYNNIFDYPCFVINPLMVASISVLT